MGQGMCGAEQVLSGMGVLVILECDDFDEVW